MHKFNFLIGLGLSLALLGCEKTPQQNSDDSNVPHETVSDTLQQQPIKEFPQTADDAMDIAVLEDYDDRLHQVSEQTQQELEALEKAGTLSIEFSQSRQLDNIHSALEMLKELDLKTAQGRYIQGLFANYWEQQAAFVQQNNAENAKARIKNLGVYLHAQAQLDHWKTQEAHDQEEIAASEPAVTKKE